MKPKHKYYLGLALFFAIFILSGCKAPKATEKTIVMVKHDTVITPVLNRDTIYNNVFSRDTMYLKEKQLTIKYVYRGDSSAYISGTVQHDTVIKIYRDTLKLKTVIQQVKAPKTGIDWLEFWVTLIVFLIVSAKYGIPWLAKLLKLLFPSLKL